MRRGDVAAVKSKQLVRCCNPSGVGLSDERRDLLRFPQIGMRSGHHAGGRDDANAEFDQGGEPKFLRHEARANRDLGGHLTRLEKKFLLGIVYRRRLEAVEKRLTK